VTFPLSNYSKHLPVLVFTGYLQQSNPGITVLSINIATSPSTVLAGPVLVKDKEIYFPAMAAVFM
jgi:hypothetical protein